MVRGLAARAKADRWTSDPMYIEWVLTEIASITEVDFSRFDLDQPLPDDLTGRGGNDDDLARLRRRVDAHHEAHVSARP